MCSYWLPLCTDLLIWLHKFISNHNVISKHKAIKNTKRKRKCPKIKKIIEKNPTVIWCLQIMTEAPRHGKAMSNVGEDPPKKLSVIFLSKFIYLFIYFL